ncbi:transglutaminase-like domain-containing protein [Patulibacter defluvii]|uniref:transglutaminase-like domain-containing protein n=1 Tax=Patulibacter defluvii TaxID=3095358 RepID=UPI002A74E484|nr:transglutaminase family protein [Patulibacter sp. DM4]
MEEYLAPGAFVESDHPKVVAFAAAATAGAHGERERLAALFTAVRDGIRYDPFAFSDDREHYRASAVVDAPASYCVPKSILLCAGARALGVPARLAFADVRNHLQSERLRTLMGIDLFVYHGYVELHVDGHWRKASPAFNRELCARFGVDAIDFDGSADAVLHPFDGDGARYMEYVRERGSYADFPFDEVVGGILGAYPGFAVDG